MEMWRCLLNSLVNSGPDMFKFLLSKCTNGLRLVGATILTVSSLIGKLQRKRKLMSFVSSASVIKWLSSKKHYLKPNTVRSRLHNEKCFINICLVLYKAWVCFEQKELHYLLQRWIWHSAVGRKLDLLPQDISLWYHPVSFPATLLH